MRSPINKIPKIIIYVFFLVITFSLYTNSLHNDFLLDDDVLLVNNLYIKNLRFIPKLFTTDVFHFGSGHNPQAGGYYRPLQTLSYSFEYIFWKLNPFGYHLTNILIHSLNSFLLFLLIYLLFKNRVFALFGAILFCVHPMQVSLVAFIGPRSHLLGATFILSSMIAFIRYSVTQKKTYYILSLLGLVLALLSCEGGFLLPLLIVSCGLCLPIQKKRIAVNLAPYILICLIYWWLRIYFIPFIKKLSVTNLLSLQRAFDSIKYICSYFDQLIFPYGLREMILGQGALFWSFLSVVSFALLIFFLLSATVSKDKRVGFALLVYTIGLLPIFFLIDRVRYLGAILSEHYAYVSSIGFCIFIAWLVIKIRSRFKKTATIVFVLLITLYSTLTVINNTNYKDGLTFYNHILAVDKDHTFSRINLGIIYYKKKMYDQTVEQARFVLASEPNAWHAYSLLGNVSREKGDLKKAEEFFNKASLLNPYASGPVNNLGVLYRLQGNDDKALEFFKKAYKINPESVVTLENLVELLMEKKLYSEALAYSIKLLDLDPYNVTTLVRMGVVLAESGRVKESEVILQQALRFDPNSIDAISNLGSIYGNMGDFDKAVSLWKRGLQLDPDNENIKRNMERLQQIRKD